jgi:outer membrane receptor protein involved in Fe transport
LAPGTYVTDTATALNYLGGRRDVVPGPGYERVNMSIFKEFKLYREHNLEFRADIFNLFNTPALANPSNTGIASNGGQISGTRSLQNNAPDSRFIQLSLRYAF